VPKHRRALLDTSVVIDLERIDPAKLPEEPLISAITMAELAAGVRPAPIQQNVRVVRIGFNEPKRRLLRCPSTMEQHGRTVASTPKWRPWAANLAGRGPSIFSSHQSRSIRVFRSTRVIPATSRH
jgi:hypothetical protein